MSDYELVDAFMRHVGVIMVFFMAFLSATSAFLVVVHLAAAAIPKLLVRVTVTVYTASGNSPYIVVPTRFFHSTRYSNPNARVGTVVYGCA
jgi:hypothetical protein